MIGVVLCSHLNLAEALLQTARMILGDLPAMETVAVEPGDDMDDVVERIRAGIERVDDGSGVLLLCDMFGGTPSNLSLSFLGEQVEVVTGMNLPMLIKLFTAREQPLAEVAQLVCRHGRENILVAGDLLNSKGAAQ
jgi:PTS system mannose-specific IIA component